jgi:hypothetical protein
LKNKKCVINIVKRHRGRRSNYFTCNTCGATARFIGDWRSPFNLRIFFKYSKVKENKKKLVLTYCKNSTHIMDSKIVSVNYLNYWQIRYRYITYDNDVDLFICINVDIVQTIIILLLDLEQVDRSEGSMMKYATYHQQLAFLGISLVLS